MLRLKVDFIKEADLYSFIEHLESKYEIIEKSTIKESKKKDSKYRVQYIDLIERD